MKRIFTSSLLLLFALASFAQSASEVRRDFENRYVLVSTSDAKQALDKIEKGGYYYIKYLPLMLDAIGNARNADSNPDGYMPELLQTKVYQLGGALYERMGKVRFEKFVDSLPSIEKEILKHKKRK